MTAWENRKLPELFYSSLAQSVEHSAVNRVVVGSSPTRGAMKIRYTKRYTLFLCFCEEIEVESACFERRVRLFNCMEFDRAQWAIKGERHGAVTGSVGTE